MTDDIFVGVAVIVVFNLGIMFGLGKIADQLDRIEKLLKEKNK